MRTKEMTVVSYVRDVLFGIVLAVLAHLTPAHAAEGTIAGLKGKHFTVAMSANDELCRWMFQHFERNYSDQQQQPRYDDDPKFIRWKKAENVKMSNPTDTAFWAEFDVDNDGIEELVVRETYTLGPLYVPNDVLKSFRRINQQSFLSREWEGTQLSQLRHMLINLSPTSKPFTPGRHSLMYHPDFLYGSAGFKEHGYPQFGNRGYINPFSWESQTYLVAFPSSRDDKYVVIPTWARVWAIVIKLKPDGAYEDVCYLDRERLPFQRFLPSSPQR